MDLLRWCFELSIDKCLSQLTKDVPKLKCLSVFSIKDHSILSKAFSKSTNNNRPGICSIFVWLIMLSISLIFSPINLFFKKPV